MCIEKLQDELKQMGTKKTCNHPKQTPKYDCRPSKEIFFFYLSLMHYKGRMVFE